MRLVDHAVSKSHTTSQTYMYGTFRLHLMKMLAKKVDLMEFKCLSRIKS
jgi:hypothetical protein